MPEKNCKEGILGYTYLINNGTICPAIRSFLVREIMLKQVKRVSQIHLSCKQLGSQTQKIPQIHHSALCFSSASQISNSVSSLQNNEVPAAAEGPDVLLHQGGVRGDAGRSRRLSLGSKKGDHCDSFFSSSFPL